MAVLDSYFITKMCELSASVRCKMAAHWI